MRKRLLQILAGVVALPAVAVVGVLLFIRWASLTIRPPDECSSGRSRPSGGRIVRLVPE